jgi:TatD DNase family protein
MVVGILKGTALVTKSDKHPRPYVQTGLPTRRPVRPSKVRFARLVLRRTRGKTIPAVSLHLYDAHNHLQDERFGGRQAELLIECQRVGIVRMVVNGSCEEDWPQVFAVAAPRQSATNPIETEVRRSAEAPLRIIPSFGYHPWYIHERTKDWLKNLTRFLDQTPSAVGEIGLDRWKPGLAYAGQEEVFIAQLRLAAERNLPASIHCLQAWGRMLEILKSEPRPARGFLLHSYGGPQEMVKPFADLGAYFSLPGYFAHERKERQRETFRHVPAERLLIETDAPDQSLPDARNRFPLTDASTGKPLNHPANLRAVYEFAAELVGAPIDILAVRVEENFGRLFGNG